MQYTKKTLNKYNGICGRCNQKKNDEKLSTSLKPPIPTISSPAALKAQKEQKEKEEKEQENDTSVRVIGVIDVLSDLFSRMTLRSHTREAIKESDKGEVIDLTQEGTNKDSKKYPTQEKKKSKRTPIPSAVRKQVWDIWIGSNTMNGECFVCANIIQFTNFHCAHVIADAEGGEVSINNLRPTCALCNTSMKTEELFSFMEKHQLLPNNPRLLPINARELIKQIPHNWNRKIAISTIDDIIEKYEVDEYDAFRTWVIYLSWMLFENPKIRPDHVDMFFLNLNITEKPTEKTNIKRLMRVITENAAKIWPNWVIYSFDSVKRDVTYYKVYLKPYDDYSIT